MIVRLVFFSIPLLYVLQHYINAKWAEPYPGLFLPGFGGSGGYKDGRVHLKRFDVVAIKINGKEQYISSRDWFGEFPDALHSSIAESFFSPVAAPPRSTRSVGGWASTFRATVFPGLFPSRQSPEHMADLRAWVGHRLAAFTEPENVTRVDFRWFECTMTYSRLGDTITVESSAKDAGVFSISLRDR